MTEDYKELLGQYITGNLTPGTSDNQLTFKETQTDSTFSLIEIIAESLDITLDDSTYDWQYLTSDTTDNIVIYGKISPSGEDDINFISILDSQYNVLYSTTTFASGTTLKEFVKLEYDEDGNIWGVDIAGTTTETGYGETDLYRFIMLNNVAIPNDANNYEVKLRKSYTFPTGYNNMLATYMIIKKVPDEATYYFLSNNVRNTTMTLVSVQINVGSSNEWWTDDYGVSGYVGYDSDMLLTKEDDTNVAYVSVVASTDIQIIKWTEESGAEVVSDITIDGTVVKIILVSSTEFYYASDNTNWQLCHYENGTITLLDEDSYYTAIDTLDLKYINGLLFFSGVYAIDSSQRNIKFGVHDGTTYSSTTITEDDQYSQYLLTLMVKNNYSLYNMILLGIEEGFYETKITYYTGLYNGSEYDNYNSLIGNKGEVYKKNGSSNELAFARQLYNLTTNTNTTIATLEVPNAYLNNNTITNKSLLGATNTELVVDTEEINKNIYEALYINFINTINVMDEDTSTSYLSTASNINTNINNILNALDDSVMENKKIAKIRINYQDSTSTIKEVQITQNSTYDYTIQATIYVEDYIDTIDIISYDESEIYISLDGSNLTVGNTYAFSQDLRIE